MRSVLDARYLIGKAEEADLLADAEHDPDAKDGWIRVAAFWLGLAERAMERQPAKDGHSAVSF